jgi:hypothetical protein
MHSKSTVEPTSARMLLTREGKLAELHELLSSVERAETERKNQRRDNGKVKQTSKKSKGKKKKTKKNSKEGRRPE